MDRKKGNFQLFNIELRIHVNTFPLEQQFSQSCNFMTSSRQKGFLGEEKFLQNNLFEL